jgi:hypothetical protein
MYPVLGVKHTTDWGNSLLPQINPPPLILIYSELQIINPFPYISYIFHYYGTRGSIVG